jgi:hypothetical protein
MAYTVPNADDLTARFPAFAAVAEETIDAWLTDAQLTVTGSWIEADYSPAIMELAAHNMALLGIGATGAGSIGGMAGVTGFRSGSFSANFSDEAVAAQVKGGYASTPYGKLFAVRLRRNRGGVRVTGGGTLGCCW